LLGLDLLNRNGAENSDVVSLLGNLFQVIQATMGGRSRTRNRNVHRIAFTDRPNVAANTSAAPPRNSTV